MPAPCRCAGTPARPQPECQLAFAGIRSWEHEDILDRMQEWLERTPEASKLGRSIVEHTFGTLKAWMGATHFLTRTLPRVSTEMSLHVLAYNLKRLMRILGTKPLMKAMTG